IVELTNVAPDVGLFDFDDPHYQVAMLACLGVILVYYFLAEWIFGRTIGKAILGLRVTQLDGSKLSLKGALLRTLIRALDTENLLFAIAGMACILKTKRRQRLGDLAAGTVVLVDRGP
ncbi:MAG TPA: RDD family protein, partial [Planctomycetota bacterium]|nr:RDD family protein [Planctomycetota bacterium]